MNKINYQKELDRVIEKITEEGKVPKLLLHVCCAPCSSYCLEYLSKYFDIRSIFTIRIFRLRMSIITA